MNNTEKQFIELLSKTIRNDSNIEYHQDVNWNNLINLAGEHRVEEIIYPLIEKNEFNFNSDNKILEELKTFTLYTAISEVRKLSYLENIFNKFEKNKVQFIALKELVLRTLYPKAEQRIMYDVDLLVCKKDLRVATDVLEAIDYEIVENNKNSIKFMHKSYPIIELHWTLIKDKELDESIWDRAIKKKVSNKEILTLGYEDLLVYLCNNIIENISKNGLVLRQIIDISLFSEVNREKIDWTSFKNRVKEEGIEKFVLVIFSLCSILFKLNLPEELSDKDVMYNPNIDILIESLLLGGINGNEKILSNTTKEDYSFMDNIKKFIRNKRLCKNRGEAIKWLGIQFMK